MSSPQKTNFSQKAVLIIEPNASLLTSKTLKTPYSFLSKQNLRLKTVSSIESALDHLVKQTPNLVFLSTSFSPHKTLNFLEALKNHSTKNLIPLILVVDLSLPASIIPGTTWGENLGIIHTAISIKELQATLKRFL